MKILAEFERSGSEAPLPPAKFKFQLFKAESFGVMEEVNGSITNRVTHATLMDALKFVVRGIRAKGCSEFFELSPNVKLQEATLISGNEIHFGRFYLTGIQDLNSAIQSGLRYFIVYFRDGNRFVDGNTINFNNIFKFDIDVLAKGIE